MTSLCPVALLAALTVWDYPERQAAHESLKAEYLAATRAEAVDEMKYACEKGVELLPDDPVWRYNLACALARNGDGEEALDSLERAVRLGFRDAAGIAKDPDFGSVSNTERFGEILKRAKESEGRPVFMGPNASIPAEGAFGSTVALGEQNLKWDLDKACFLADLKLKGGNAGKNAGDLYFNRDGGHSVLKTADFPGLTTVTFDSVGRGRGMALDMPNTVFPYPVFGNCSRAMTTGPMWRSIPRALVTTEARRLMSMYRFYLSNQTWVFPAVFDCGPDGKYGDVFASVAPYWIATEGKSWSDQPYIRAALEVSRTLKPETKAAVVAKGLLAPTIQALIRKSLKGVKDESAYLTPAAHPTAFPKNGLDMARLKSLASSMQTNEIPPVAIIAAVAADKTVKTGEALPEVTYFTPCAWAFVLRTDDETRRFAISAAAEAGSEIAFAKIHGAAGSADIKVISPGKAEVTLHKSEISPVCRVDIGVFAKTPGSMWGAPSIVSFAVVDPTAPYSDPFLTPPQELPAAKESEK